MLHIYHSNFMERLVDQLIDHLSVPLAGVLTPEIIVVQNAGMQRRLAQEISGRLGVAANLQFPLPASFVWSIQQAWIDDMPEESGYDKESLCWRIMGLLPKLIDRPAFASLRHYLADDDAQRRYQLSERIADLYDQYLVFRPDMMIAWERSASGKLSVDAQWQAELWRALVAETDGEHRAGLYDRFRRLISEGRSPRNSLPERVTIFGVTTLAPVQLHAVQALAQQTEVHLYLLNPCREYWVDIVDEKGLARRRARWRQEGETDVTSLLDVGNPLLASMGQVGQVFVDQLLELDGVETDLFTEPGTQHLLQRLQGDILELTDRRFAEADEHHRVAVDDVSIQVHSCHTPLREVQVLHDRLRRMFDTLPGLAPADVVVMAPDISTYAPYVEAVFGSASGKRHIPWSLADLGAHESSPIIQAVYGLLELPDSRFEASQIITLLETPALSSRFGIDSDGIERIRRWVRETGIRWGADAGMRAELGLPAESANTWDAGLERLFHGFALPLDAGLQDGVLAYPDIEGGDALDLGRLAALLDRLLQWRKRLSLPANPVAWVERINALLTEFFLPQGNDELLLQSVRNGMDALRRHCESAHFSEEIPLAVVRAELDRVLEEGASSAGGFLVGGVTFCNMVPMRSIPFRVVCLLGMNDSDYPRREQTAGFDLIAAAPLASDRTRRLDDRYLFLEALISAREIFYISYLGNSVRDNSVKTPSVVLSELLDYTTLSFTAETGEKLLSQLVTHHPLQPFSRRYFDASDARYFNYDEGWLAAANVQAQPQEAAFIDTQLSQDQNQNQDQEREIDLDT